MSGGAHGTPASGRANRRRGADAERQVVNYLREHGYPDARRYLAGDGKAPGDIDAIPGVSIEVKDRARSAWPEWREQALTEAGWRVPIVVRRTRGVRDVGLWRAETTHRVEHAPVQQCPRTGLFWWSWPFAGVLTAVVGGPLRAEDGAFDFGEVS